MTKDVPMIERRRAVRMRPLHDFPIAVWLVTGAGDHKLDVSDVSVGGLALVRSLPTVGFTPNSKQKLRIKLPMGEPFEVQVEVRHMSGAEHGTIGVMVIDPTPAVISALGRYVAELLERGAGS
jgi:hypothetical protein